MRSLNARREDCYRRQPLGYFCALHCYSALSFIRLLCQPLFTLGFHVQVGLPAANSRAWLSRDWIVSLGMIGFLIFGSRCWAGPSSLRCQQGYAGLSNSFRRLAVTLETPYVCVNIAVRATRLLCLPFPCEELCRCRLPPLTGLIISISTSRQNFYGLSGHLSLTSEKERSCSFPRIYLVIGNGILQSPSALSDFCG